MQLQDLLVDGQRLALVASRGIHARKRGQRLRVLRLLRQHRRQGIVGAFEVAQFAQRIDLAQRVAGAQRAVAGQLLRRHRHVLQLAQHRGQLGVLVRAQQHAGILQAVLGGDRGTCHQPLRQGEGTRRVAGIGLSAGQRGQQRGLVELVAERGLGARQQQLRLACTSLLHQQLGLRGLLFNPRDIAQRAHFRRTRGGRYALQAGVGGGPIAAFLRQQRIGVQRLGQVAMHGEQAIHHTARLVGASGVLVQPGQVQADPGVARTLDHRRLKFGLRGHRIAGLQRLPRTRTLHVGTQRHLASGLLALGRREPVEQFAGFLHAALAAVQRHQALQGAGIVRIQRQGLAIARLGGRVVAAGQQRAQRIVPGGFVGQQAQRLLHQLGSLAGLAALAGGIGLLQQQPVARRIVGGLPLAVAGRRRAQQFLRLGETLLAQAHRAQPAQRLGVARTGLQHLGEAAFGTGHVAAVERLEGLAQQFALRVPAGGGTLPLAQFILPGLDLGIVGIAGEVGLVQRRVGRAGIEPQQRLAPGGADGAGDRGLLAQGTQLGDALAPGGLAIRQHLRQGQRHGLIVAVGRVQPAQAVACPLPSLRGAGQYLVVLQCQVGRRRGAVEQAFVGTHRLRVAAAGGGAPRVAQLRIAGAAATFHGKAQPLGLRRRWMPRLQGLQPAAGFLRTPLGQVDHAQAQQRVRLRRIHRQQLAPGVSGQVVAALVVPVVALVDQLLGSAGLGVGRREHAQVQQADQAQRCQFLAEHGLLQAGTSCPSAVNR